MKIRKYLCAVFYFKKNLKRRNDFGIQKQTSNQSGKSYIEKCIYGRNNNLRPNHGRRTEQGTPLNKATMDALKEDILNEVQAKLDGTFVPCCTTVAVEYFNADGVPVRVSLSKTSSHI